MKFILWVLASSITLLLEVSVLPSFFGTMTPILTLAVLIIGIAMQDFWPGFWFTGLSGLARDILAPASAATHTPFLFGIFLIMHLFRIIAQWEEPLSRMGSAIAGLVGIPIAWVLASAVGRLALGLAPSTLALPDLVSRPAFREIIFSSVWLGVFCWFTLRRFGKKRATRLSQL